MIRVPWWVWVLIGVVTGGAAVYVALGLYMSGAFRR